MENNGSSSNTNNKKWNGKKKFKYNPNRNSNNLNNTNKPVANTSVNKPSNLSNNRQNNNINSNQKNNSINNRNGYNNSKHYNKNYHNNRNKVEKSVEEYEKEYIEKKKNLVDKEYPICPVCKEPIYIIETSIKHLATGENAHFDCIIKELTESNELEKNEKVIYLGSGTFGIIQDRVGNKNDRMKFFVRKRIAYEDRKEKEINIDTDTEEEEIFDV